MLLSKVHIENYRSIENLELNLKKCSFLVGKNNSGKSNVLKAINLVLGEGFVKTSLNDFFNRDDTRVIKIKLIFTHFTVAEKSNVKRLILYPVRVDRDYYAIEDVKNIFESSNEITMEVIISSTQTQKNIYFGDLYYKYFSNDLRDAIVSTLYIPSVRDPSKLLKINDYSFLNKLLNKIYENADEIKKEELAIILQDATEKCKELFVDYEQSLDDITKSIIEHNGLKFSMLPTESKNIYKKLDILLDDGFESELDFKGSGIQSVVIISLFKLYSDLKIGQGLLLIEEPESFLHPQANRHLAKVLSKFCNEENMQILIATHSPTYLQSANVQEIILLNKKEGKTNHKQIENISDETKLKKELNNSNLELFFADKVILVEGETEKILLPVIAKQVDERYDFDKKNFSIIDVGSKSNLGIFIELLNKFEIPWISLVDNDFVNLSESKKTLVSLNNKFAFGFDIETESKNRLIELFKGKGVYVLSCGEIENYYSKKWLYQLLDDYICQLDLSTGEIDEILLHLDNFTDPSLKIQFCRNLPVSGNLSEDDKKFLLDIITIKEKILLLDIGMDKLGKELEKILSKLKLTKPKIAVKLKDFVEIEDIPPEKKEDITSFISKIFVSQ
nr:AAA family ATPase [uncultured Methanolobus sp.]